MRTFLAVGVIGGMLLGAVALSADDTPGDRAIRDAIKLLQEKKNQAGNPADLDKIEKAITALKNVVVNPGAAGDVPLPALAEKLKAALRGRPSFNAKSGELTLVYDFSTAEQLKDFDVGDTKPKVTNGALTILGSDKYTHRVLFKTVQVSAEVYVSKPLGFYLGTTQDVQLYIHDNWNVEMWLDGKVSSRKMLPQVERGKLLRFTVTAQEKRVALQAGSVGLAAVVGDKPRGGKVMLQGGHHDGAQFRNLVITGEPDPNWMKTLLAP